MLIQTKTPTLHQGTGWYAFLLALVLIASSFLLQSNIGLDLADEGYLWYGAVRTANGDIPIKDFRSYDPGRYYWAAAWSLIFGQGIIALRLSVALFQLIGLTLGLLTAKHVVKSWWELGLVGLLLMAWMYPRPKLFESSLAMTTVYIATRLVEKPVPTHYFFAGVFVGLTSFMGRNLVVYSFCAFFFLILFIWLKLKHESPLKQLGLWAAGIALGCIPMLATLLLVPGMLEIYWFDKVLVFFRRGATNMTLPIPWPWAIDYAQFSLLGGISQFFIGLFFLLLPLFYVAMVFWLFLVKPSNIPRQSLLIASTVVGVFFMHYAFSRADREHLAPSIYPFLLGWMALLSTMRSLKPYKRLAAGLAALILIFSFFAITSTIPFGKKLRNAGNFVLCDIAGDQLWLEKKDATYIDAVKQLVTNYVDPHEGLLIAPHTPGMYPILRRESPIYDAYLLFPETKEKQENIIDDLIDHRVNWVILADIVVDGRNELRFRYTHPLVWEYLMAEFEVIETPDLLSNQQFLKRKIPL